MNAQEFFKKNMKYIIIVLILLFFLKSFQSCNRNMNITKLEKQKIALIDSIIYLHDSISTLHLSIKDLNYEVKLAQTKEASAIDKANAIQSTAAKIRKNTTIKIENNSYKGE